MGCKENFNIYHKKWFKNKLPTLASTHENVFIHFKNQMKYIGQWETDEKCEIAYKV